MSIKNKLKHILAELKGHAPFTALGAGLGVLFMIIFRRLGQPGSATLFEIFHPMHVVLSAMVTASLFSLHTKKKSFLIILLLGYFGSIGTATLSDSILPYFGETLFGLSIPTEGNVHSHQHSEEAGMHADEEAHEQGGHKPLLYLGFIEEWAIVNPAAVLGVIIAYFLPRTKFPHAGHILISTWASAAHIMMNLNTEVTPLVTVEMFIVLFIAVWLPCCFSDIIFPMLFVKSDVEIPCCHDHKHHSHEHIVSGSEKE